MFYVGLRLDSTHTVDFKANKIYEYRNLITDIVFFQVSAAYYIFLSSAKNAKVNNNNIYNFPFILYIAFNKTYFSYEVLLNLI